MKKRAKKTHEKKAIGLQPPERARFRAPPPGAPPHAARGAGLALAGQGVVCRRPARRPRHGASPALCRFLEAALLALSVPPNRLFVYRVACMLSEKRHPAVAFNRLFASPAVQGELARLVTSGARSCERLAHLGAAALGGAARSRGPGALRGLHDVAPSVQSFSSLTAPVLRAAVAAKHAAGSGSAVAGPAGRQWRQRSPTAPRGKLRPGATPATGRAAPRPAHPSLWQVVGVPLAASLAAGGRAAALGGARFFFLSWPSER